MSNVKAGDSQRHEMHFLLTYCSPNFLEASSDNRFQTKNKSDN